ncbi:MAG: hypothetical protein IH851_03710 [Armatimonadetes bacterium]|nr:hypothetical protein [Armatimonadota bacterium]
MACLDGDLWRFNVVKITIVDVTEDYRTMQDPLPAILYPILKEVWLPKHRLQERLLAEPLLSGYQYDRHEGQSDPPEEEHWYVGVVSKRLS